MKKDKQIAKIKITKKVNNKLDIEQDYSIRATEHSILRMKQRGVDEYVVSGTVLSLGHKRLLEYQVSGGDIAIIDKVKGIAVIATFKRNTIKILTVINKSDIYVKDGTVIKEM